MSHRNTPSKKYADEICTRVIEGGFFYAKGGNCIDPVLSFHLVLSPLKILFSSILSLD